MCQMLQLVQTPQSRADLRSDLRDYVIERAQVPWLHDLLVACQEATAEDLELYRSAQPAAPPPTPSPPSPPAEQAVAPPFAHAMVASGPDNAGEAAAATVGPEIVVKALAHATSLQDDGILHDLQRSLPHAVLDEQIRAYLAHEATITEPASKATSAVAVQGSSPTAVLVYPHLLKSRMQAAAHYDKYRENLGCRDFARVPRGALTTFITNHLIWMNRSGCKNDARQRALRAWHKEWKNNCVMQLKVKSPWAKSRGSEFMKRCSGRVWSKRLRQRGPQGRRHSAPYCSPAAV